MKGSRRRVLALLLPLLIAPIVQGGGAAFVEPPTLTLDPAGKAPLSAAIEVATDTPSQVTLRVTDGIDLWTVKYPEFAVSHSLPLFGLKPGRTYFIEVTLTPGGATDSSLTVTTAPLPADFPGLTLIHADPERMEPGFTLLDSVNHGTDDPRPRYAIIVDAWGDVVWYSPFRATAIRQDSGGNLVYRRGPRVHRTDLFGNETVVVRLEDPGEGLHHDLIETDRGTWLTLGFKSIEVVDYPTSETDPNAPPATAAVRDEPVFEFAADGSLLHEWSLADIIDPTRIGYGSLRPSSLGYDWIHLNAVIPDPADDSLIVSSRHQDAVVKFSRTTGELSWILAPHDNWTAEFQPFLLAPVGAPFEWSYHQHAPLITPEGNFLLFDNGNFRASPFDGQVPFDELAPLDNYSRAVEYAIDETTLEIRQVWEYGFATDEVLYSWAVGDVDWLPTTGNVLIDFGSTRVMGGVTTDDLGYGTLVARVLEVTRERPTTKVFDLLVFDPEEVLASVYRAERIPSLYDPSVMVSSLGPVAAGSVPDGGDSPGTPLTLDKASEGDITLAWGRSCVASDLDYSIYEGRLGEFESHVPVACSTAGTTTSTVSPIAGSSYFLIVPTNGSDEGSYGTSSDRHERPASTTACLAQALAACPSR